jgi:hypothetical protein
MASWPEEDELVAELLAGDEIVGFVRQTDRGLTLTVTSSFETNVSELAIVLTSIAEEF